MDNQRRFLKEYQAPAYKILSLDLHFDLDETKTLVQSRFEYVQLKTSPLILDGIDLDLKEIRLNGNLLSQSDFMIEKSQLKIKDLPPSGTLEIKVQLNPSSNTSLEGLYMSKGSFCTQCEAEGFRKITYFLDRPDVMTSFNKVTLVADQKKFPVLLSNGNLLEKKTLSQGRHQVTYQDPHKKPCYLFALFAGDLGQIEDHFTTRSGRQVQLQVFSPHGTQARCLHAMASLKNAMKWDEERFGREYDLDSYKIVAIDDFNAGAMENKGLNIFNSRLVLADAQTATDEDYFNIESVVAHEYFHNWTGNRVTLRDWFQLSLKEGLTVFRDQEFSGDMTDRGVQRINDVDTLRERQFPEDAGPNAHPIRPESCLSVDNFFTPTIYEKGSEIIRMMQTLVGRPGFRKGMDEYFRRHDGQAVTIDDFAAAISDSNQINFDQFRRWYSQAGTPIVKIDETYDTTTKKYKLHLRQELILNGQIVAHQPFFIPLRMALLDEKGNEIPLDQSFLKKNSEEQTYIICSQLAEDFVFDNLKQKPVLSILRDFSAPVKLQWNPQLEDLYFLAAKDSDSFNRREILQKLALDLLEKNYLVNSFEATIPEGFFDIFESALLDSSLKPAYQAQLIQMPSAQRLALQLKSIDGQKLGQTIDAFERSLAIRFESSLLQVYEKFHPLNPTSQNSSDFGPRALKNNALKYLAKIPNKKYLPLIENQYFKAQNMTDRFTALQLLCEDNSDARLAALKDFENTFKEDAVVFNKWFTAQASSEHPETLQIVKNLCQHSLFDVKNPNNVYSLLRAFGQNIISFYSSRDSLHFMLDKIFEIDSFNPQVAARLCGSFQLLGKLNPMDKAEFQKELRLRLESKNISRNTRELLDGLLVV